MSNTKINSILHKIQTLLKIAESSNSKAERETAAALAQKLIAEHQVNQAQLDEASGKVSEQDNLEGIILFEAGKISIWKSNLAFNVAELNSCYCLSFSGIRTEAGHREGTRIRVFGKPSDIELTQYMFNYLLTTITQFSRIYVPSSGRRGKNSERESWCLGCVDGFLSKMRQERDNVLKQASNSTSLVLMNRPKEIENKLIEKNKWSIRFPQASKAHHDADAYTSGYKKGQTLTVNPGIGGSNNSSKQIS